MLLFSVFVISFFLFLCGGLIVNSSTSKTVVNDNVFFNFNEKDFDLKNKNEKEEKILCEIKKSLKNVEVIFLDFKKCLIDEDIEIEKTQEKMEVEQKRFNKVFEEIDFKNKRVYYISLKYNTALKKYIKAFEYLKKRNSMKFYYFIVEGNKNIKGIYEIK